MFPYVLSGVLALFSLSAAAHGGESIEDSDSFLGWTYSPEESAAQFAETFSAPFDRVAEMLSWAACTNTSLKWQGGKAVASLNACQQFAYDQISQAQHQPTPEEFDPVSAPAAGSDSPTISSKFPMLERCTEMVCYEVQSRLLGKQPLVAGLPLTRSVADACHPAILSNVDGK